MSFHDRLAALAAAVLVALAVVRPAAAMEGLHDEPWFLRSLLILAEDFDEARAAGKRFAIVWEQKGCPYCRDMHRIHLAAPEITSFVTKNFSVLQLDLRGDRMVTDFDGEVLSEKDMARKYRINLTPTIQFLPMSLDGRKARPADIEVARMPGLLKPDHFLAMFEYVHGRHYEKLQDFHNFVESRRAGGS